MMTKASLRDRRVKDDVIRVDGVIRSCVWPIWGSSPRHCSVGRM